MNKYRLEQLQVTWLDSEAISKSAWPDNGHWNLKALAAKLGVSFQHHDALEDAKVVSKIVLQASQRPAGILRTGPTSGRQARDARKRKSTSVPRKYYQ